MEKLNNPPPVRRIKADKKSKPAKPSAKRAAASKNGRASVKANRSRPKIESVERMRTVDLGIAYGGKSAVNGVSLQIKKGEVLALIGPSGCGKTTYLRSLNLLVEQTPTATRTGKILLDGEDVDKLELTELRRKVGMVFQQPNPFPMSIFDNIAYGIRERGSRKPTRRVLKPFVEEALDRANLLEEVKDNLSHPALRLSGGQQQRLCIARALAVQPDVLLLDEPTASLDPMGTQRIEELLYDLRDTVTVIMVTHNMQQAARISDVTAFLLDGRIIECAPTRQLFTTPSDARTEAYITGRFG